MDYLLGDVQGCLEPLERLLQTVGFSASRDRLFVLGDLVNRGPDSLGVLRKLRSMEGSATCLLGNHDLHLLAVAHGVRQPHRSDTLGAVLDAPDRDAWVHWLRQQRLAVHDAGWLMVHAGVLPAWDVAQTMHLAGEVESMLRSPDLGAFLHEMYGNQPASWSDALTGLDRWRCVVNALTRLRFCSVQGAMEFATKEGAHGAPEGFMPWFDVPERRTRGVPVAFGHWSTLGLVNRADLLALDTGCVWGGCLSAARLGPDGARELVQVRCPQAQKPGA